MSPPLPPKPRHSCARCLPEGKETPRIVLSEGALHIIRRCSTRIYKPHLVHCLSGHFFEKLIFSIHLCMCMISVKDADALSVSKCGHRGFLLLFYTFVFLCHNMTLWWGPAEAYLLHAQMHATTHTEAAAGVEVHAELLGTPTTDPHAQVDYRFVTLL